MADLLDALGRVAERHPETRYIGEIFHAPASEDDGRLRDLRTQVGLWLRSAISHGRVVGAVRDDIPERLLIEALRTVRRMLAG